MSKKTFTKEEIDKLSKNEYVKNVSEKGITYTDEFKRIFIKANEKGQTPKTKDLTIEEKLAKLEAQVEWLKIENEFLKKLDMLERQMMTKEKKNRLLFNTEIILSNLRSLFFIVLD